MNRVRMSDGGDGDGDGLPSLRVVGADPDWRRPTAGRVTAESLEIIVDRPGVYLIDILDDRQYREHEARGGEAGYYRRGMHVYFRAAGDGIED